MDKLFVTRTVVKREKIKLSLLDTGLERTVLTSGNLALPEQLVRAYGLKNCHLEIWVEPPFLVIRRATDTESPCAVVCKLGRGNRLYIPVEIRRMLGVQQGGMIRFYTTRNQILYVQCRQRNGGGRH